MIQARLEQSAKFDPALEGLRGLACLLVLLAHLLFEGIDPHFTLPVFWSQNLPIGREAVLLFFLISGYVIGLVSGKGYSPSSQREYLWKRFLRLVPLYWLALIVSFAAFPIDSIGTIITQVFFLQNTEPYPGFRLTVMKANYNLWSLNYEVVYYLTFLIVWRLRPKARALATLIFILMALGFTGWIFPHQPKILTGYAVGGAFWYTGLWMVWYGKPAETVLCRLPWISILLLLELTPHLGALNAFMKDIGFKWPTDPNFPFISLRELQMLPIGLIILAGTTRRVLPLAGLVWTLALLQPLAFIAWNLATQNTGVLFQDRFPLVLTVLAICCFPLRQQETWLRWLCPTGLISYGIYIFARPVQYFIRFHFETLSGTWWTFTGRVLAAFAVTFLVGYVMELTVQPWIRSWLRRRFESKIIS